MALTWLKIVQSFDNNIEIIDHKFLISGHSFLPNDRDFGLIEMKIRKTNNLYFPEHYYELMQLFRKFTLNTINPSKSKIKVELNSIT
jgi:hypothetical protein